MDGLPVAIFAEDPLIYGGAWTADSCKKLVRFCDLASTFHLPLIHLVDCPALDCKQSKRVARFEWVPQHSRPLARPRFLLQRDHPQSLWRRGRSEHPTRTSSLPLRLAVWRLGLITHRGGIEVAYKAELLNPQPRATAGRYQSSPEQGALSFDRQNSSKSKTSSNLPNQRDLVPMGEPCSGSFAARPITIRLSPLRLLSPAL